MPALGQGALNDLGHACLLRRPEVDVQVKLEAVRIAGFRQEFLGLGDCLLFGKIVGPVAVVEAGHH